MNKETGLTTETSGTYIVTISDKEGIFAQLADDYKTLDEARVAAQVDKGYNNNSDDRFRYIIYEFIEEV